MADSVADRVLDNGLNELDTNANQMWICSSEPTTFAQAATVAGSPDVSFGLGVMDWAGSPAGTAVGSPYTGSPDLNGRAVDTTAVTAGIVLRSGLASHWALVDSV